LQTANQVNSVADSQPTRQRYLLAFILLITIVVAQTDRINVSLLIADPKFLADMGVAGQSVLLGSLMSSFLIAYGISTILLGPLGDYLGPRKSLIISIVGWEISLLIGGMAPIFMALVASRVLLGIGEAMLVPQEAAFVKNWFPPSERGKANAVWSIGFSLAPAIAIPMLAAVIHYTDWRVSYYFLAVIGLAPLLMLWFCTTDTPRQHKKVNKFELDHIEAGLAQEQAKQAHLEKGTFKENLKVILTNYPFWLLVVYYIAHNSIYYGAITWLPAYLKVTRGFSWAAMGMLASLPFWLGIIAKIIAGYVMDKTGRRAPMLLTATVLMAVGIYASVQATDNMASALLIAVGLTGIGFGAPASFTLLQDLVPGKTISTSAGIMTGISNAFASLTPIAIGFVTMQTGKMESGLMLLVGIAVVATIATFILTIKKY